MVQIPTALPATRFVTALACVGAFAAVMYVRAGPVVVGASHFSQTEPAGLSPEVARWLNGWHGGTLGRAPEIPSATFWEAVPVSVAGGLSDVATVSASEAWALSMGSTNVPGEVLHFVNGAWEVLHARTGRILWSVSMTSPDDGWVAGFDTSPIRSEMLPIRDGVAGEDVYPECSSLIVVHMHDDQTGWAGGNSTSGGVSSSCILRYSDGVWNRVPSPGGALVTAFALNGAEDGWAIGSEGDILRLVAGRWEGAASPVSSSSTALFYDASVAAPGNGWAVGTDAGQTLRLMGDVWRIEDIGAPVSLFGVDMVDTELGWAAGRGADESPVLMRFDGNRWQADELPPGLPTSLLRVDIVSADVGWAVGGTSAVRRLDEAAPTATASASPSPSATPVTPTATTTVEHGVYLPWGYAR